MGRTILLVTWDGAGNVPPELAACRAWVEAGHAVHVLTHDALRERVERTGALFRPIRRAGQLDSRSPDEAIEEIVDRAILSETLLHEVREAMDALAPDLVVADSMLLLVLALFAQSGVPSICFHHTLGHFLFGGFFDQVSFSMKARVDALLEANGLDAYERPVDAAAANDLILSATFEAFDRPDAGLPSHLFHVGPLRTPRAADAPRSVTRLLPERPWVVVSLSTSFMGQLELLQATADALAGLPVEGLITTGPAIDPGRLTLADNVAATPFVAHDEVLPDADLLVTHAGHGTVAAGASLGVPMLCVPMGRDQPMVAARAAELGLARVCAAEADARALGAEIGGALADTAMKASARAFAGDVEGHPGLDELLSRCHALISA